MSLPRDWTIGTGALGHGGEPSKWRTRPDLCAEHDHPGVTYHPQMNQTWCLCGDVIRDGDQVRWPKADGIYGPLREYRLADGTWPSGGAS